LRARARQRETVRGSKRLAPPVCTRSAAGVPLGASKPVIAAPRQKQGGGEFASWFNSPSFAPSCRLGWAATTESVARSMLHRALEVSECPLQL
jgi:hypothetical protein